MNQEQIELQLNHYKKNGLVLSELFTSNDSFLESKDLNLSFSEFWLDVQNTALQIYEDTKEHQRVAVSVTNQEHYLRTIFALWLLNKSVVALSHKMPVTEIKDKMQQTKCSFLLNDEYESSSINNKDARVTEKTIDINTERLIVFTSGSSGGAKGVRLSLKNLIASALGTISKYEMNSSDSWLLSLPLNHVGGLLIPIRTLLSNCKTILSDPSNLHSDIIQFKPRFLSLVSTQLNRLIQNKETLLALKQAKGIILGGGPTGDSLLSKCQYHNLKMANSFGQTETAAQVCSTKICTDIDTWKTVGKPMPFRQINLKDEIIHISGETVALGYIQEGEETNFNDEIKTTDLASYNTDGDLIINGRADHVFISGGENINPKEIEDCLKTHQKISDTIVVPVAHCDFGKVPFAFLTKNVEVTNDEIISFIKSQLSSFHCPKGFYDLNKLPTPETFGRIKFSRSNLSSIATLLYNDPSFNLSTTRKGNLTGEVIVLLHGFMGNKEDFDKVINNLSKDFFCIAIDLPGHGKSDSIHFNDLSEVIENLSDLIKPLNTKVNLLGYSQGGRVAFGLALHSPNLFNSLIIESANPGIEDKEARLKRYHHDKNLLTDIKTENDILDFLQSWYKASLFYNISHHKDYQRMVNFKAKSNPCQWNNALNYLSVGVQPNYWPLLEQLSHSLNCHIISGSNDLKYTNIAKRLDQDTQFTHHLIKDVGHNCHFEKPEEFSEIISSIIINHRNI